MHHFLFSKKWKRKTVKVAKGSSNGLAQTTQTARLPRTVLCARPASVESVKWCTIRSLVTIMQRTSQGKQNESTSQIPWEGVLISMMKQESCSRGAQVDLQHSQKQVMEWKKKQAENWRKSLPRKAVVFKVYWMMFTRAGVSWKTLNCHSEGRYSVWHKVAMCHQERMQYKYYKCLQP